MIREADPMERQQTRSGAVCPLASAERTRNGSTEVKPRLTATFQRPLIILLGVVLAGADVGALEAESPRSVLARRAALQQAAAAEARAVPALAAGLDDANAIVRRTAVRLLVRVRPLPEQALSVALRNRDALVRRIALDHLVAAGGPATLDYLATGLADPETTVRYAAVARLAAMQPRSDRVRQLLDGARADAHVGTARLAAEALWDFHREVVRLGDRQDWDYEVRVTQTIPLPTAAWRFRTDPRSDGHVDRWYDSDFDDSTWREIAIEQAWQKAGIEYTGVSWYRRRIDLPAKPDLNAVEIRFEGVDESAWVWVNGVYVGAHDIGPEGWNEPFSLDVTQEVKWDAENLVVVRAMSTKGNGGIWRPVNIAVLK